VVGVVTVVAVVGTAYSEKIQNRISDFDLESRMTPEHWGYSLERIGANPILGAGPERGGGEQIAPDSEWLDLVGTYGVLGVITVVAWLGVLASTLFGGRVGRGRDSV